MAPKDFPALTLQPTNMLSYKANNKNKKGVFAGEITKDLRWEDYP